ncbi:hypothetical protein AOC19_01610 [Polynucleobacter asymbioticus]|uniref:hypothetical protein n=1 Tax=Polynucleobacter asymbioticus TaxID=576611 RepID=UPI001BFEB18C|nr:hypothetical protein [Polynucleobacter asymbioticus]QWD85602.1 hypothetical protein AOC19_01610 [Polynucleobacter asymbioticus]
MINLFGWVYEKTNQSTSLFKYFWLALRRLTLKLYPSAPCRMEVYGVYMILPFNNALPGYLFDLEFGFYESSTSELRQQM